MDRGAWRAAVQGVTKSGTRLSGTGLRWQKGAGFGGAAAKGPDLQLACTGDRGVSISLPGLLGGMKRPVDFL